MKCRLTTNFYPLMVGFALLVLLGLCGLAQPHEAGAVAYFGPEAYFNSSESGCNPANPNPNYLMCDDWEDGTHIQTNPDILDLVNDGWQWTSPKNFGGAACGAGIGMVGTNCVQRNILNNGADGSGNNAYVSTHGWYQEPTLTGYRFRAYIRFAAGYQFNSNQKFMSGQRASHNGGIDFFGLGRNLYEMELCPVHSCNNLNEGFLGQNQGNNLFMTTGKVYYLELRFVLNTVDARNGIFQMWINDCGTTGVCTGSPTLRSSYTNVFYRGNGFSEYLGNMRGLYLDIWGNPSDGGTLDIDQLIVARDANGPIGFMGASNDITPPVAPTNLQIQ